MRLCCSLSYARSRHARHISCASELPKNYWVALQTMLRRIHPRELRQNTGLSVDNARKLLESKSRFIENGDGTLATADDLSAAEQKLVALNHVSFKPAFAADSMVNDLASILRRGIVAQGRRGPAV